MYAKIRGLWEDRNFRTVLAIFLVAKILVFVAGYAAYFYISPELSSRKMVVDNPLLNPWAQFDGRAYLDIAKNGYNYNFNNLGNFGWFPIYPLLIKVFSFIGYDLAAFLIPNIFSIGVITLLYLLFKQEFSDKITKKAILYFAIFPTAYFLSVMYSESIFLFFVLLTFYFARRDQWLYAGIAGFLASLTRLPGIVLFLPVMYLYAQKHDFDLKKAKHDLLFVFLIPLGLAVFLGYMFMITGDPFNPFHGLALNQKQFTSPWTTLVTGEDGLWTIINQSNCGSLVARADCVYHAFNFTIAIIFTTLGLLSLKYLKRDYSIYFLATMAIVLFSNTLQGVSRFVLVIFPAFALIPILEEKYPKFSLLVKAAMVLSIILLLVLTARHVNMHLDAYGL